MQASQMDCDLATRIKELRSIRNDIVHTQLKFVQIGGELQALALNSQQAAELAPVARLLKLEHLATLRSELSSLKTRLDAA